MQTPNALPPPPLPFFGGDWDTVMQGLEGPDARYRLIALEELVRFWGREERVLDPLLEAIHDGDPSVRRAAALGLGKTGRHRDQRLVDALKAALRDEDQGVRGASVAVLVGQVAAGPRDPELLRSAIGDVTRTLWDPDASTRWDAARLLGRIGDQRATAPLAVVLQHDEDFRVRAQAAKALGEIGDAQAAEPLIMALSDPQPWVREGAAQGLAKLKDVRAVEPLIAALLAPPAPEREHNSPPRNPDWVLRAAEALGKIGDPRALEPLLGALQEADPSLRVSAAKALGDLGDSRAVDPLIAVLTSVAPALREATAEALGKIGGARAVRPLIDALRDDECRVREKAAEALGVIGDAQGVDPLIAVVHNEPVNTVRWWAAKALSKIDDPRATQALEVLPYHLRSMLYLPQPPLEPLDDRRHTIP